jgi:DNA-binding MarR family transcriptional regulator
MARANRSTAEAEAPVVSMQTCNHAMLRRAMRRISQLYDTILAEIGLRTTQYSILRAVERLGPSSLNDLAAYLGMDRSTVGHNLRPLQREKLLALAVDPADRRSRKVTLTRGGQSRLAEARILYAQAQDRFELAYGPDRAAALRAALDEIASDEFAQAFARGDRRGPKATSVARR